MVDRGAPKSIKELMEKNISTVCPYCLETISLIPQEHTLIKDGISTSNLSYFIARCPNHKRKHCKPIFAVYNSLSDCIIKQYPYHVLDKSQIHLAIPENIKEDYAEAKNCLHFEIYKGAVVLFRRVVEAIACDKLGKKAKNDNGKSKRLCTLIDQMYKEGLITKDLKESADEVRFFGNYGAHINDDGLDTVRPDEAKEISGITMQLLKNIYILPYETQELKKKRKGKSPIYNNAKS